jgi:hypothetical protein
MSKENKIGQAETIVSETIRKITKGRTKKEEADVIRILNDPSGISDRDIDKYYREPLAKENSLLVALGINLDNLVRMITRNNTPYDHRREVMEEAERRAKKWKLKLGA